MEKPPIWTNYNVHDHLKDLTIEQLKKEQQSRHLAYAVAMVNLNGDLNIGTIIRNAVVFGAEKVFIFGHHRYDKRSAVGSHVYIAIDTITFGEFSDDVSNGYGLRQHLRYNGYTPVFFEQSKSGQPLQSLEKVVRPCLVFGNEGYGMSEQFMGYHSHIISLKQEGIIRSLNVSVVAGIACHAYATNFARF